jgi:predicted nucleic acid-binding protein
LNFLLDTNVVSEWMKPRPNVHVVDWLGSADEDSVYLSVLTFAEIRHGVEQLPTGRRRESLMSWLEDELPARFYSRILLVDLAVAASWGAIMARSNHAGFSLNVMDAFFAATAQAHNLTLVTRNTRHFEKLGLPLLNPWEAAP